jgi:hypothetical protein
MSQDNREKPAVKTTIVGGRPAGSGKEIDIVPHGIEILLKKAAIDESFRKIFLHARWDAADAIGLTLNPAEAAILKAIPESSLELMVAATKVQPKLKHAFMGYTAAVMLAALTATSGGIAQNSPQPCPDDGRPQGITAIAGIIPTIDRYRNESYMKISPSDSKTPTGNLEVSIDNDVYEKQGPYYIGFFKIHFTKTDSPGNSENNRTEGLGFAEYDKFLQENIPIGNYLVEIGFANGGLRARDVEIPGEIVRTKNVTIEKNKSAKVHFKLKIVKKSDCTTALDIE